MKASLVIVVGCATIAVAGCGISASEAGGLPTIAASPAETPTPPVTVPPASASRAPATSSGSTCGSLALSLRTSKPTYSPSQTVTMTATLTNTGTSRCTITSGASHGFTVATAGTTIWTGGCQSTPQGHASVGFCAEFEMLQTMQPGQVLTRSQPWAQQRDAGPAGPVDAVPAGSYAANEAWAGQRASAAFTIT